MNIIFKIVDFIDFCSLKIVIYSGNQQKSSCIWGVIWCLINPCLQWIFGGFFVRYIEGFQALFDFFCRKKTRFLGYFCTYSTPEALTLWKKINPRAFEFVFPIIYALIYLISNLKTRSMLTWIWNSFFMNYSNALWFPKM